MNNKMMFCNYTTLINYFQKIMFEYTWYYVQKVLTNLWNLITNARHICSTGLDSLQNIWCTHYINWYIYIYSYVAPNVNHLVKLIVWGKFSVLNIMY